MKKKILTAVLAASLMSSTALAHTNSVGYVGDGTGNITVWYGSWHDGTTFNEAELKVLDANDAKITQTQFNLLSQDSPAGLISGVNYFGSDGTQLIDYDVNTGGGESYTWQGATFTLAPGDYTFVYIPLQDAESTLCPAGTAGCGPTQDWVPMDEVIRSLSITLTQNDIDGDANANGILDTTEVAVGDAAAAASGPTVVSQGSSKVIGYVATSNGIIQIVQRTQTDTTWDNMSDGTTDNVQVTNTTLDPFEGRIDQIATAKDIVDSNLKQLSLDKVSVIGSSSKYDNGMTASTNGFTAGITRKNDKNVLLGFGFAKTDTKLKDQNDVTKAGTTVMQLRIGKELKSSTVVASVTHATTDYQMERSIGDFSNTGSTKGTNSNINITVTGKGKIAPVLGYTVGRSKLDSYNESGSIQTARSVAEEKENYNFVSAGVKANVGPLDVTLLHHTDLTNSASIGLNYKRDNVEMGIRTNQINTKLGKSKSVTAGLIIKF